MFNRSRENCTPVIFRGFFALLLSLVFIFSPWSQMVLEENPDVEQYLLRIDNLLTGSDTIEDNSTVLKFLSHEPVWRYILIYIGEFFDKPIDGLQSVSFCTIFIYAFFLCGRVNLFLVSYFLFNPMVVDLVMAQVRSAFAMALCLVALMINNKLFRLFVIAIASMVHSVTFILFLVYIFAKFLELKKNNINYKNLGIVALFFGVVLAIILGGGREIILGAIGDRRAEEVTATGSYAYLSFWLLLAVAFAQPFMQSYDDTFREYWTDYYSIVMLTLPFVMAIFGANSTRFAALSFPIFLYSMSMHKNPAKTSLIGSLFAYQIIQYLYWLKII